MSDKWLIWSNEHGAWWLPNACGYTPNNNEAGEYTLVEAHEIVKGANRFQKKDEPPNEAMVPDVYGD